MNPEALAIRLTAMVRNAHPSTLHAALTPEQRVDLELTIELLRTLKVRDTEIQALHSEVEALTKAVKAFEEAEHDR